MKLVGIDPGGTTGWATLRTGKIPDWWGIRGQIGPGPHYGRLWSYLERLKPDRVICEGYHRSESPAEETLIIEGIGVVKAWGQYHGVEVFISPSSNKQWANYRKLALCGVTDLKYKNRHAVDAQRHLLHYAFHCLQDEPIYDQLVLCLKG